MVWGECDWNISGIESFTTPETFDQDQIHFKYHRWHMLEADIQGPGVQCIRHIPQALCYQYPPLDLAVASYVSRMLFLGPAGTYIV